MRLPGTFWIVLVVLLIPTLMPILQSVFPQSSYWWSAILVVILAAIAKTVEIVYRKQIAKAMPTAAAAPAGDGDYTTNTWMPKQPGAVRTWLLG